MPSNLSWAHYRREDGLQSEHYRRRPVATFPPAESMGMGEPVGELMDVAAREREELWEASAPGFG